MRQRRRLVLLAAASVAVLAAGCGSTSAAVTIDGDSTSRSDFEDQLDEIYESDLVGVLFQQVDPEQLRAPGGIVGGYSQAYVGDMVSLQVQFAVAEDLLDDEGIELTDDDREATEDAVENEVAGAFDGLSASTKRMYVDGFAAFDLLRAELGEEFEPVVIAAIEDADVAVSSRYGTWNGTQISVDPPAGPRPAPGTGDTTGLGGLEQSAG